MDVLTVGATVAGAALLATGVILYATGDDPGRYEGLMLGVQPGGAALSWTSTW